MDLQSVKENIYQIFCSIKQYMPLTCFMTYLYVHQTILIDTCIRFKLLGPRTAGVNPNEYPYSSFRLSLALLLMLLALVGFVLSMKKVHGMSWSNVHRQVYKSILQGQLFMTVLTLLMYFPPIPSIRVHHASA